MGNSYANFYSASRAQVRFNGVPWIAKQWTATETPEEGDVSNFEVGPYSDAVNCLFTLRVQIDFDIDGANNPWQLGFMAATVGTTFPVNLQLYLNGAGVSPFWYLPLFLIGECTNPNDVRSTGKGSVKIRNKGSYTRPLGLIST